MIPNPSQHSLLLLIVLLPLAGAPLAAAASRFGRAWSACVAGAAGFAALALVAFLAPEVLSGQVPALRIPWMPALGLNLSLRLDGLSLLFALLVLGIGLLVILYAHYYLDRDDPGGRFYALLLSFMAAMLGVLLSANLLLTVVFWEGTSLVSFLLVGYWRDRTEARRGALMALAVTGGGGVALLAGVLLLGHVVGSFELREVLAAGEQIRGSPLYLPMLVLILLGAFTKSAQFPFHFWLPDAMAAPTPVSAYLHSATLVKAGIFLLARLDPVLAGTPAWAILVSGAGLATLVYGAFSAAFRHDLKGLLAYSTISHLGLVVLLFGMGTELAAAAALFHVVNHATFKASLFMAAGIIDHETGTRDMRRLNGLWKYMPHTGTLAIVAASAMAGVPLLNGFLSKEMFFGETLLLRDFGAIGYAVPVAAVLAGLFSVAYSLRFVHDVFFNGEPRGLVRKPHEPPRWMKVPVEVLVAVCLLVGMLPELSVGALLDAAVAGMRGAPAPQYDIALWHGFSLPLAMSALATVGGVGYYFFLQRWYRLHAHRHSRFSGRRLFEHGMGGLLAAARRFTGWLQGGGLAGQLAVILAASLALAAWPLADEALPGGALRTAAGPLPWLYGVVLAAAAVATVSWRAQPVKALLALGVVGVVVSAAFVYLSAPDLALTQLAVEIATIVLILAALGHMPREACVAEPMARRARDAALAAAGGLLTGLLAWAAMTRPPHAFSQFFLERSLPEGGGSNVVNVILVDFRGFDTLGEISVLALAALGVSLLVAVPRAGRVHDQPRVSLVAAARTLFAPGLLLAAWLFMRGHNLPGGGFVAGLVTALVLLLLRLAAGDAWFTRRVPVDFLRLAGLGLLVAAATGAGSWLFGHPFLSSATGHPVLPLLGEVPLASAMTFDLGVYLTVVGAVTGMVLAFAPGRGAAASRPLRGQMVPPARGEG